MEESRLFEGFPNYIVTSPFGMRTHPVTGKPSTMHNGIDLVATCDGKTGQVARIKAHTGGVVDGVGYDPSAGNYIRIRVDLDTVMYYFHLRDMSSLTAGEVVQTGQVIGVMGETGKVSGKHLHFGIKYKGQWIDPEPYLDADYSVKPDTVKIELNVLRRGCKGTQVETLQRLLLSLGYYLEGYGADGSFGGATERAVKAFQKANGLYVDGIVGYKTWCKLLSI